LSSVTGIVDGLEKRRVVRRLRSEEDRRVVTAELTAEGRRLYKLARDGHVEFARRMLRALDAGEQDALVSLFRKIAEAIKTPEVA
jgi:DNA-binding MarR family transcriptional regulator